MAPGAALTAIATQSAQYKVRLAVYAGGWEVSVEHAFSLVPLSLSHIPARNLTQRIA